MNKNNLKQIKINKLSDIKIGYYFQWRHYDIYELTSIRKEKETRLVANNGHIFDEDTLSLFTFYKNIRVLNRITNYKFLTDK